MLCGLTDIFALLSNLRGVFLACYTMLLPKVIRKMLVKDACLENFNQCLIINGYLRAKVVPDDNELMLNNDGLVPNNVGQVPHNDKLVPTNDELVPTNDEQVPNDKNQCLIVMSLCLILRKQT